MKIESKTAWPVDTSHTTKVQSTQQAQSLRQAKETRRPRPDEVALSRGARELQKAKQVALDAPDIRADRVAQLRQQIRDGTYYVSD